MKSRNEIGPSRAIRSQSLSIKDTCRSIIFSGPMATRAERRSVPFFLQAIAAAALVAAAAAPGCAAHRTGRLPTLSDYSDGVSDWADALLAAWKSGAGLPDALPSSLAWSGPLPGEALSPAPARPPLEIAVYRSGASPHAGPASGSGGGGGAEVAAALGRIRARFRSLGRCEAVLFGFRRRGEAREVLVGILLTGRGPSGELRQEGGKLDLTLERFDGRWRAVRGAVREWMAASASSPLFEERA
jgi:hypothetical protein